MSMSTTVVGIKPPDIKWKKMKEVYDACMSAQVDIPDEVDRFFGGEKPDEKGVVVSLRGHICCVKWQAEMEEGFEVNLNHLPEDISIIRFYNSY